MACPVAVLLLNHVERVQDEEFRGVGAQQFKELCCGYRIRVSRHLTAQVAQGIAGAFLVKIVGSYSNIVGLPLYETMTLLGGEGYPIHFGWLNAV